MVAGTSDNVAQSSTQGRILAILGALLGGRLYDDWGNIEICKKMPSNIIQYVLWSVVTKTGNAYGLKTVNEIGVWDQQTDKPSCRNKLFSNQGRRIWVLPYSVTVITRKTHTHKPQTSARPSSWLSITWPFVCHFLLVVHWNRASAPTSFDMGLFGPTLVNSDG